jgi:hypothetical protein
MSEKFANLAETTLASGYTATDATISVTDASLFPTAGTFRVALGNDARTILKVTSVSGTTFTVTAEEFDDDAAGGASVTICASKGAAESFLQAPASGETGLLSGAAAVDEYGRYNWKMPRLDQSGWSWLNQGSAAVTQGSGVVAITAHSAGGTSVRGRYKAIPSTPFTITMGLVPFFPVATFLTNLAFIGLGAYESGTGKIVVHVASNLDFGSGNALQGCFAVQGYTNSTTSNTNYAQHKGGTNFNALGLANFIPPFGSIVWLRMFDNGTNVTYSYSWDKITWVTLVTQTRTTGFTTAPDKVGLFFTLQSGSISTPLLGWVVAWEEE